MLNSLVNGELHKPIFG